MRKKIKREKGTSVGPQCNALYYIYIYAFTNIRYTHYLKMPSQLIDFTTTSQCTVIKK